MKQNKRVLVSMALLSAALSGCGGGLEVDDVKKDFDNPTGSLKDKHGVIAASGKQALAGFDEMVMQDTARVPGFGLASTLGWFAPLAPGTRLGMVEQSHCFIRPKLAAMLEAATRQWIREGLVDLSASDAIEDLASCDSTRSGRMDISMRVTANRDDNAFVLAVKEELHDVCDRSANRCLNGFVRAEASPQLDTAHGLRGGFTFVSAWDLVATEGGESVRGRGGLSIGFGGNDGDGVGEVAYLQYVPDSSGNEVSYVLRVRRTPAGGGSLEIRGQDGTLTCSMDGVSHEGHCSGTGPDGAMDVGWTNDEYDVVTSSSRFRKE